MVVDGGPNETTSAPVGSPTAISRPPRSNTEKNTDLALSDLSSSVSEQDGTIQDGASEDELPGGDTVQDGASEDELPGGDKNTSDTPTPTTPEWETVENLRKEKDDKIEILEGKINELERELDNERKTAKAEKEKAKYFEDELTELKSKYIEELQSRMDLKLEFEEARFAELETRINKIGETIRHLQLVRQGLVQKRRGARPYNINPKGGLGVALIISIHKVKGRPDLVRGCASNDDDLLEKTLQGMGFKVVKPTDESKKSITQYFENLDEVLEDDTKMFLCFIGAHGGLESEYELGEFFYSHNGFQVYLKDIYDAISKCCKLKGSQKL